MVAVTMAVMMNCGSRNSINNRREFMIINWTIVIYYCDVCVRFEK